jgi:NAD(P)-dependent dehydrogenase (short-subunit alcohol dehydrogenase family)
LGVLSKFDLTSKKAAVTGASQGLGEAIAVALAEAGSDIAIVVDKNISGAKRVAQRIRELGRQTIVVRANVASGEDVCSMVEDIVREFGRIDVLVNNAGINKWIPAEEMNEDAWDSITDVNLKGVFLCSQAVGRQMIKRRTGSIINVSSIMGVVTQKVNRQGDVVPQAHYHASKGGVIMLTKALASEWVKYNIRVNCISPGWFTTPTVEEFFKNHQELYEVDVLDRTPMKRPGNPAELGPVAVFLASDASNYGPSKSHSGPRLHHIDATE